MGQYRKLWLTLIAVLVLMFSILGYYGKEIYNSAPPIPEQFSTADGRVLMTREDILRGQSAWQSTGGMQLGSIWGHGAYQAPDWTADWLHRELLAWLNIHAQREFGAAYEKLNAEQQAVLQRRLQTEYRTQSAVNEQGTVTVTAERAQAMEETAAYYVALYGNEPALQGSRESFAMKENTLPDATARQRLANFFFWTAWVAATNRPGSEATYTNNWPHEPLIANHPTPENVVWSVASVVFLLAGIGFLVWGWSFLRKHDEADPQVPAQDPISTIALTPSQKALGKYAFLVLALFVAQTLLGGLTAHYTVEGQQFYGIDISQWLPYALVRTWHIQAAMFWVAGGFLAAGLFLAPIINGGKDPKWQKLGVDILFVALVVVCVGSFAGNFFALRHAMPAELSFWFGHQGYEFIELGRFWHILKYVGILFWLVLMVRGIWPAFSKEGDKNLLALFFASVVAVGLFYGAGLMYGERTHLSVMEYWRWWVVHLWVEGFFEVFATAALAFIFVSMGLVSKRMATAASLASASIFMVGGTPGTFHHLYFSGTTTPIMALGASFSALEVVPLVLLGHEAWEHWSMRSKAPWMQRLVWPLRCFVAVAFWNMLGAGVFGFMINPPISLYYIQGLNTTAVHAHAALFGVYGFLALGFVLLIMRYLRPQVQFNETLMQTGFWCLNAGIVLMIVTSLLPIGVFQAHASISQGLWYARSEGFLQQDFLETLRWVRTIADLIFIAGAACWMWQVVQMLAARPAQAAR